MRETITLTSTFLAAVALATVAGVYHFPDSGHAMGLLSARGGKVTHAVKLPAGQSRYGLVVTATVLPPYRGDATVSVEGNHLPTVAMYASKPVIDLHLRRRPRFDNDTFHDLRPGDHLALWVALTPPPGGRLAGQYRVAFKDPRTDKSLMAIPVALGVDPEGCCHEE
jgi:hypothetical protein